MNIQSGDVVQVVGDEHDRGSLFIVEKESEGVVYVYQMEGTSRRFTLFPVHEIKIIGRAALVLPARYHGRDE